LIKLVLLYLFFLKSLIFLPFLKWSAACFFASTILLTPFLLVLFPKTLEATSAVATGRPVARPSPADSAPEA
jgi:hypothetical protein